MKKEGPEIGVSGRKELLFQYSDRTDKPAFAGRFIG